MAGGAGRGRGRAAGVVVGALTAALAGWLAAGLRAAAAAAPPRGDDGEPVCGEVEAVGRPGQAADRSTVLELQLGLRLLALFPHPLDGRYDPVTREAVAEFQRRVGLVPDGVAGPRTWEALARAFERERPELLDSHRAALQQEPGWSRPLPAHPDVRPGAYWIVVDTQNLRLTLLRDGQVAERWPVAVGKPSTPTPVGEWRVIHKSRDWGGGFGTRWLGLDVPWGIYGIHGTNKPWSVGTRASAGCIRMFNRDVERLWDMVPRGTPVTVVGVEPEARWDQPIAQGATGWNVPLLQWALRRAGFEAGRADGRMGEVTMRAVREAQRTLGLSRLQAATPELFRALGLGVRP